MLSVNRLLVIGLLSVGIIAATTAQAGVQMFTAEWYTESFGNELTDQTTVDGMFYSKLGIPAGIQCNDLWPRCPFASSPTTPTMDGFAFNPLGGLTTSENGQGIFTQCQPWTDPGFGGAATTVRPAKGGTQLDTKNRPIPPLYRNYAFFTNTTPNAAPNRTYCTGTSTSMGELLATANGEERNPDATGGIGLAMIGNPVAGTWSAYTEGGHQGDFSFIAARANYKHSNPGGIRAGRGTRNPPNVHQDTVTTGSARSGIFGDFANVYPYVYSYSYATLRNDVGVFGAGQGVGSFTLSYTMGNPRPPDGKGDAQIYQKAKPGGKQFGGTMRMLGAYLTRVCFFRNKGCSLGRNDWRYDAIGDSVYYDNTTVNGSPTVSAMVSHGYLATYSAMYYHSVLMQTSTVEVEGARFPWTTGTVTLKATGRGPHKTVHYATGYDNRDVVSSSGKGTIQLVTPVLTRWTQPCCNWETGGVGILRIKFVPEPQTWAILVAGISLLGVGYRMRQR
jgi:hypothetical protein